MDEAVSVRTVYIHRVALVYKGLQMRETVRLAMTIVFFIAISVLQAQGEAGCDADGISDMTQHQ